MRQNRMQHDFYRRSPRGQYNRPDRHDRRVYVNDMQQMAINPVLLHHDPQNPLLSPNSANTGRKYFYNTGTAGAATRTGNRTRLNSDTRREFQTRPPTRPRTKTD